MIRKTNLIAFLGIVCFLFVSCQFEEQFPVDSSKLLQQDPLVLVVKHRQDSLSGVISDQVTIAMQYAKLPVESIDLGLLTEGFSIKPSVRSIVVTTELLSQLSDQEIEYLTRYVARGNQLVFLGPLAYDKFAFLQGIVPFADYSTDSLAKGVYFFEDAFPVHTGKKYFFRAELPHRGLEKDQFIKRVKVLAGAGNNPEYPLVLLNEIGAGEVVTINSTLLWEKLYRGLIFSTILRSLDGVPYSVANVSTIFLDDFPAPLYNEKLPPIDTEYDVTHSNFVLNIWWPDMKALADTFNVTYSAMTAFNYNANVTPPFDFEEWTSGKTVVDGREVDASIRVARDILNTRHELAFHGYNHFSLWLIDWDNVNFMAASVNAARKRWRIDRMGPLPISYVPPTNFIDSVGVSALMKGMPSIRYLSSLYLGDIESGGGREFDYEPYSPDDRIFNYPRITSGFSMEENSLFQQQSMQLLTGIWTHFIHPDDVFQVQQREEDEFISRNPLGLGWKSHPVYKYGLYHVFRERMLWTNERYKGLRYLSAKDAGAITEDWHNSFVFHDVTQSERVLIPFTTPGYQKRSELEAGDYWYSYVSEENSFEFEESLENQSIEYQRAPLWEGSLYQFESYLDSLVVPNYDPEQYYDPQFISAQLNDVIMRSRRYQTEFTDEFGNLISLAPGEEVSWVDTRLNDAIKAYQNNPEDFKNQEELIKLSIEFSDVRRAILILERRMLATSTWVQNDIDRLFTYYGWDELDNEAENFLERLWLRYESQEVIDVKNFAVEELGIYNQTFNLRWLLRERELNPNDEVLSMRYVRFIESQENWPIQKQELKRLIGLYPESDSLYAFTLQRSFYFESSDSTIQLLESFPSSKHPQLEQFARNFALIYAYDLGNYPMAMYWADKADNFNEEEKLDLLLQQKLYSAYTEKAMLLLDDNPEDDSLRVKIGTQLYYAGFTDEGKDVMYPVFEKDPNGSTEAHTLMSNEISFLSYEQRKQLYDEYPAFFNKHEHQRLKTELRWNEGPKVSAFGEYRSDNFDNNFGRFGLSTQLGNRLTSTHTVKIEDLFIESVLNTVPLNFVGPGYEFSKSIMDGSGEFKIGGGLFFGSENVLFESSSTISTFKNNAFTSLTLSFVPELTEASIANNYNRFGLQGYREDTWGADQKWATSLSAVTYYYTNSVFEYETTGRVHFQSSINQIRIRPIALLYWADASDNFVTGVPYFTPDRYFEQGLGFDLRYRDPDTFDFLKRLELELMAKHEIKEGVFGSGRIQYDQKFNSFWKLTIGSEISSSKIYRSNRLFFTLSYYLNKKSAQ
ncbi:MAG: DUF2194 domain-containing protein [Balneola sp.]|nr:MAG: DUF2194 domain-containing protein [Balneola sp.]